MDASCGKPYADGCISVAGTCVCVNCRIPSGYFVRDSATVREPSQANAAAAEYGRFATYEELTIWCH